MMSYKFNSVHDGPNITFGILVYKPWKAFEKASLNQCQFFIDPIIEGDMLLG